MPLHLLIELSNVHGAVFSGVHQYQILWAIVLLLAVFVVDHEAFRDGMAEYLLKLLALARIRKHGKGE
jgi:hypothetical protein